LAVGVADAGGLAATVAAAGVRAATVLLQFSNCKMYFSNYRTLGLLSVVVMVVKVVVVVIIAHTRYTFT
jgi:hypothetical protein